MRRCKVFGWMMLAAVICGVGCDTVTLEPKMCTWGEDDLKKTEEVELPGGYNVENFKQLVVKVKLKEMTTGGAEARVKIPRLARRSLRDRMTKLKRFTVLLPDPDGDAETYDAAPADLELTVALQATKACFPCDHIYTYVYTVSGSASIRDIKTNQAVEGEEIVGRAARKTVFRDGKRISGFNEYNENAVAEVITEASLRAFKVLFSKLGNMYPVGGRVAGVSPAGEFMTLDKGVESGVGYKDQQFTIFLCDDGVDIPLCYASGKGGMGKSQLTPWRWSKSSDAKILQKEFRESPKAFFTAHKGSLYAIGWGLAFPPEWDTDRGGDEYSKRVEK